MGQWLSGLFGWSGSHGSKDNIIDNRDLMIDELCLKIAGGQTAAALKIIKSVPSMYNLIVFLTDKFRFMKLYIASLRDRYR